MTIVQMGLDMVSRLRIMPVKTRNVRQGGQAVAMLIGQNAMLPL